MKHAENRETGRVVLVTGGSGGIGSAVVRRFAQNGDKVALHYHSQSEKAAAIENALNQEGYQVKAYQADLTKSADVDRLFSAIEQEMGRVEVLINCTGQSDQQFFQDINDESWRRTMAINLDACFYACRRASSPMIEAKSGVIVNFSSIWGMTGASMEVHYSTAKAAVQGLTKALAKELGPSGIRVNCLAPGWVETDMNALHDQAAVSGFLEETPLGRVGTPKEIGEWCWFLASPQAGFMTGQIISPNGGVVI